MGGNEQNLDTSLMGRLRQDQDNLKANKFTKIMQTCPEDKTEEQP